MWVRSVANCNLKDSSTIEPFKTLLPESFKCFTSTHLIWIRGFTVLQPESIVLPVIEKCFDNTYVKIFKGSFNYYQLCESVKTKEDICRKKYEIKEVEAPSLYYLFLIKLCDETALSNNKIDNSLNELQGFLATFQGFNLISEKLFDNVIDFSKNIVHVYSPQFYSQSSFPIDLSEN